MPILHTGTGTSTFRLFAPPGLLRLRCKLACVAALVVVSSCFVMDGRCYAQATGNAAGLLQQGLDEAARGELAKADVTLEKAQTLAPKDPDVLTSLGKVKARIGELGAATALFREVVALQARSAEAHLNLAVALADAHSLTEALSEIVRAQQLSPNMAAAHLNHARILADLHRTAEAEVEFSHAATLEPSNPDCFFYWALLERETSDYARETALLRTLVKLQPRNDQAWLLLGNSLAYQAKQKEAIASWREALAINPQSSQAVYKLSRALRTNDPAEAKRLEEDFAALRQGSENLDKIKTLGNQAYSAMQTQDWAAAITTFKQAVDLCGDCGVSGTLHKDLGLAYCNSGQWKEGRTELQIALRLLPQDPDIVRALAILDQKTGPLR